MLVPAVQQSDSVIYTMFFRFFSHIGENSHNIEYSSLCNTQLSFFSGGLVKTEDWCTVKGREFGGLVTNQEMK